MTSADGRELSLLSSSEADTIRIGSLLADALLPGDTVALMGSLGAGKTCLVKGLARGLGLADPELVTSPTFVLVNEYPTHPPLYHFDAYRLRGSEEFHFIGFDDYLDSGGICVIEWADHVQNCLPDTYMAVIIEHVSDVERRLRLRWRGMVDRERRRVLRQLLRDIRRDAGR